MIVEHDPDVIRIADHLVEMGPEAGAGGGRIVYEGTLSGLLSAHTLTSEYVKRKPEFKPEPRMPNGWIEVKGVRRNNLKGIDVRFPLGIMTVVTGVAGSGKSTLVRDVLSSCRPDAVYIDQGAIGASVRSNIATYSGMFDEVRRLFAAANRTSASLFSFNSQGACPECKGLGEVYIDFAFMDTVSSECERCRGRRFTDEVLAYTLRGKNISEVLAMTVDEALSFFAEEEIASALRRIQETGIGYLTLGQPLSTLSGGELQRFKLAMELASGGEGKLYVLDEPTTGLHMSDVERLIRIMNRLVDQGGTLIVIEHNLDVIHQADWIVDLGPGAGEEGGRLLYEGVPKNIVGCSASVTGKYINGGRGSSFV